MRVLLVTPRFQAIDAGGGEVSVGLLARELRKAGHEVRVLAERADAPAPDLTVAPITAATVAASARDADVVHVYNMNALRPALKGARRARKPVVTTANSYWANCLWADRLFQDGEPCPGCSVAGLRRDFATRDPATVGRRVPAPLARLEVARRSRTLARFDRVVVLSEASKRVIEVDGIPTEKVRVVPNMVDPDVLLAERAPETPREPLVLFVGALKHTKGPRVLIEALPALVSRVPAARLAVVGDGPERASLESRARELGVSSRVEFMGQVPHRALETLYAKAGALAFPVLWEEPFGRVVLEAWAARVPIVASGRGGPGEVISHGETGLLAPPGDAGALARALANTLNDAALAKRLTEAGRRRLADFAPDRVIPRLVSVYREVTGG